MPSRHCGTARDRRTLTIGVGERRAAAPMTSGRVGEGATPGVPAASLQAATARSGTRFTGGGSAQPSRRPEPAGRPAIDLEDTEARAQMAAVGGLRDLQDVHPAGPRLSSPHTLPTPSAGGHTNGTGASGTNGSALHGDPVLLPMRTLTRVLALRTERHLEFVDITDQVAHTVAEAGVREGFAVVFSRHTTAGIRINEHEPLLLEDMARLLEQRAPTGGYRHDDFAVRTVNLTENERVNGHSHCRSLLLGASENVPISGGRLLLGRWQRIFLVELDGPAQREFLVQVVGG